MSGGNWIKYAEAFTIFAKYETRLGKVAAEHDEIYAGPQKDVVSEEDAKRLDELGWHWDSYCDSWRKFV